MPKTPWVLKSARPSAAHVYPPFFASPINTPPIFGRTCLYSPIFDIDRLHPPKVIFAHYIYAFRDIFNASKLILAEISDI